MEEKKSSATVCPDAAEPAPRLTLKELMMAIVTNMGRGWTDAQLNASVDDVAVWPDPTTGLWTLELQLDSPALTDQQDRSIFSVPAVTDRMRDGWTLATVLFSRTDFVSEGSGQMKTACNTYTLSDNCSEVTTRIAAMQQDVMHKLYQRLRMHDKRLLDFLKTPIEPLKA